MKSYKWPVIFFVLTIIDLISTYYVTPDLSNEANRIVVNYKLGWIGFVIWLIFVNIFWISLYLFHQHRFKYAYRGALLSKYHYPLIYIFNQLETISWDIIKTKQLLVVESIVCGVTNFFGFFWIVVLSYPRVYAIIDNFLIGFYLRHQEDIEAGKIWNHLKFLGKYARPVGIFIIKYYFSYDQYFEQTWWPIINNSLMCTVAIGFFVYEYHRINKLQFQNGYNAVSINTNGDI